MKDPIVEEARKAGQAYVDSFKGDLTKVFKAVVKAGARGWRIEIAEGKIPTSGATG